MGWAGKLLRNKDKIVVTEKKRGFYRGNLSSHSLRRMQPSISRWMIDVVNHKEFRRSLLRIQFESQLFLNGFQKGRS